MTLLHFRLPGNCTAYHTVAKSPLSFLLPFPSQCSVLCFRPRGLIPRVQGSSGVRLSTFPLMHGAFCLPRAATRTSMWTLTRTRERVLHSETISICRPIMVFSPLMTTRIPTDFWGWVIVKNHSALKILSI